MAKTTTTSPEDVRTSVSSIYSDLLIKRQADREARAAKKQEKKAIEEAEVEEKKVKEDGTKMSKAERRQAELDAWKEIIVGLTGDDLDYSSPKKGKKKKYRKWIGDDDTTPILTPKPKKAKKKNYRKEFEPELNMLKTIVADQNRFTVDLQRRFQNAAGPATKDGMPPSKTLVELASAVNASRQNSLGLIREIGSLKKTIAELYLKQAKEDREGGSASTGFNATDIGLMGSSVAANMFGDRSSIGGGLPAGPASTTSESTPVSDWIPGTPIPVTAVSASPSVATPALPTGPDMSEFDPSTWGGPDLGPNASASFENIPKDIVVEWHKAEGKARFKAVSRETGQEIVGCPVPNVDPRNLTFNEKDGTVKGEFDESYKLEVYE